MRRALAFSYLITSLTACQSTMNAVERNSSYCDAVMPDLQPWDGLPLPPPQTDTTAVYLYGSPLDASHTWGILVDGNHVTARYDIGAQQMASFVAAYVGPCLQGATIDPKQRATQQTEVQCMVAPGKVNPGTAPPRFDSAAYYIYRTLALSETDRQVSEDFDTICPNAQ
jgi:hypothetical protein